MEKQTDIWSKTKKIFIGLFLVQAVLLATHLGEFWPFSIYPMFSKAGNIWTRSMIRDVSEVDMEEYWKQRDLEDLPGEIFALDEIGISQNDISNFIEKVTTWDDDKKKAMSHLFKDKLATKDLLIYRVNGTPSTERVEIICTPLLLMTKDTTISNNNLQ